jgi:polyhydroxybutyrate depolymerase
MNKAVKIPFLITFLAVFLASGSAYSQDKPGSVQAAAKSYPSHWDVEGVRREALVFVPATSDRDHPWPVVFVFPDHGETAKSAAAKFHFETAWPEALVIYMEGLPTPSHAVPDGSERGWQHGLGDQGDRDLKFFDAVIETLKQKKKTDPTRIYVTGQGNGGGLVYCLWAARPEILAAAAPSGCSFLGDLKTLRPLPILHIAGRTDDVVPFEKQQATMASVKEVDQCIDRPLSWPTTTDSGLTGAMFTSKDGVSFVSLLHDSGHSYPDSAVPEVVKFFKMNARKASSAEEEDDISDEDLMDLLR